MSRYRITCEIDVNAPDIDKALEYVATGIASVSDDGTIIFTYMEEVDEQHECGMGCIFGAS